MEYRNLFISTTDDCDENKGGYYCQVYLDEDMEYQIDDFCIHPEELETNPDTDYWIRKNIDDQYYEYELDINAFSDHAVKTTTEMTMEQTI